jgi:hypothetical protein
MVPPGYPVMMPMQPAPTSGTAVVALVLGVLTVLGGFLLIFPVPLIWVLSHIALNETKDGRRSGRGMAIAGSVLAWVAFLPTLFWTLNVLANMAE